MKPNKLAFLNPLRFIAAMFIATVYHYTEHFVVLVSDSNVYLKLPQWLLVYVYDSYLFIEMFFMVSGILFYLVYVPRIDAGKLGFGKFLKGRLLRMYPLMIFTIVFIYIEEVFLYATKGVTWNFTTSIGFRDLVADCVFGGQAALGLSPTINGPAWYIGVTMECFILAYLIHILVKKTDVYLLYAVPIAVGCLMNKLQIKTVPFFNMVTAQGLIAFFLGVYLAMLLKEYDKADAKIKIVYKVGSVIALLIGIWLNVSGLWELMFTGLQYYYLTFLFLPVIILLYDVDPVNRVCDAKPVAYLGKIAFGIYLWNFPIYCTLIILRVYGLLPDMSGLGWAILVLVIHPIVGVLSYELLEKRLLPRITQKFK